MKKDVLIVFQNILQYYSLEPLLEYIKKNTSWKFDIFVFNPASGVDNGFYDIAKELKKIIMSRGNIVVSESEITNNHYLLCLSPYQYMTDTNYDYSLSYYYGSISTKPNPAFTPELRNSFHGVLLHSRYDAECLSVYSKTYIVPNLRINVLPEKKNNSKKKTLLYLPTYGEINDIKNTCTVLKEIKNQYRIIAKGHHGTDYLNSESGKKNLIAEIADKYYPSTTDINKLFEEADLVLSDNSGAIFDTMYVGRPVCIAARNLNTNLGEMIPIHKQLSEKGVIPYTNKFTKKDFLKLFKETLSEETLIKQKKESEYLYPLRVKDGAKYWVEVIENYINRNISEDYIALHDYYVNEQKKLRDNLILKERENNDLLLKLEDKDRVISGYNNGKLYKVARKIYDIKRKILKNE